MGPLYTLTILAAGAAAVGGLAFVGARTFGASLKRALASAVAFTLGSGVGAALAALLLAIVIGRGSVLSSNRQIAAYLTTIALGGILGGAVCVRIAVRRSNYRLERP